MPIDDVSRVLQGVIAGIGFLGAGAIIKLKDESIKGLTTAAGICTALDLVAQGRLPQRGFVGQESVLLADFLANRFGVAYAGEGELVL